MKRVSVLFVLACAVSGVFGACTRGTIGAGEARLTVGRARVEVTPAGEAPRLVTNDLTLRSGDRVKVLRGTPRMRLSDDRGVWLRSGSDLRVGAQPLLLTGDVVALAEKKPLTVRAAGATTTVTDGAARVRRDLGVTAGVYRGSARVASAGQELAVPAYRQTTVATRGLVAVRPDPLTFHEGDVWDRHFLGAAMELDDDLQRRSDGFTARVGPNAGHAPGFYRLLFPELERDEFDSSLVDTTRPPGENFVGAAIAVSGDRSTLAHRWQEVFSFRDDGAPWGLVALDQGVSDVPGIRGVLTAAFGRLPTEPAADAVVAAPRVGAAPGTATTPAATSSTPSRPGSVPTTVAPVAPPPPGPTAPPPVTLPPVGPSDDGTGPVSGILDPVVDPVTDAADNLLGGLLK